MTQRNDRSGIHIALLASAFVWMAIPGIAAADHADRRGHGREDRGYDQARRHDDHEAREHRGAHGDRGWWAFRGDQRYGAYGYWYRHGPRGALHRGYRNAGFRKAVRHRSPYYCRVCRHGFKHRDRFHDHVRRHHHVPAWRLRRLIVWSGFGWVFFG